MPSILKSTSCDITKFISDFHIQGKNEFISETHKAFNIREKYQQYKDLEYTACIASGEQKFMEIQHNLEQVYLIEDSDGKKKYKKDINQQKFIKSAYQTILHLIYKDELPSKISKLSAEYGFNDIKPNLVFTAQRRAGKSVGVAIFLCTVCLAVGGIQAAVFSTSLRAARALSAIVCSLILDLRDKTVFDIWNVDKMALKTKWGGISSITCLPQNENICVWIYR